jgi:hypothetical protein
MGLNQARVILALAIIALLAAVTHSNNVFAQYGVSGNPTGATPAQLEECRRLGIAPENCTENGILAKHRLEQAQAVPETNSVEVLRLNGLSSTGKYETEVEWIPDEIGNVNRFHVSILDPNQLEPRSAMSVIYDVRFYKDDKYVLPIQEKRRPDDSTDYSFVFLNSGAYTMRITVSGTLPEKIEIPIQVTPEFPVAISLVVVGTVATIVALGRGRIAWCPSKF